MSRGVASVRINRKKREGGGATHAEHLRLVSVGQVVIQMPHFVMECHQILFGHMGAHQEPAESFSSQKFNKSENRFQKFQ
jgi:hypothetical protein